MVSLGDLLVQTQRVGDINTTFLLSGAYHTTKAYFRRYKSIFEKDCEIWLDDTKGRLLLGKFRVAEHEKYVNFILPR